MKASVYSIVLQQGQLDGEEGDQTLHGAGGGRYADESGMGG